MAKIKQARDNIQDEVNRTPTIYSLPLSRKVNREIHLKLENLQVTQAFKARGNANKLKLLGPDERKKGVITASSGNHGLGLSLAAKRNELEAIVVVPEVAPTTKIKHIKENGAQIIVKGATYDDAAEHAHQLEEKKGYTYVQSFDDLDIIAGNGSMGLEILEDVSNTDLIIAPIGGGGGISGISLAVKQIKPEMQVIGVEAANAPSMKKSIEAGEVKELPSADTFADGIAVKKPGKVTFPIVREYVDQIVTVSEAKMKSAVRLLATEAKTIAEAAGAASVAALFSNKIDLQEAENIVCVISGGNIDQEDLLEILKKR
ncbi:threonine/serine dehydratase [Candidatus Bipolaricaulota bacterium]|nr:threonine/serine dehydratase [Candidatus Bipolaricaulota bacterium]